MSNISGARGYQGFQADYSEPAVGPIFLDNVDCAGDEDFLANCTAQPVGQHNCLHIEDAGVLCEGMLRGLVYTQS